MGNHRRTATTTNVVNNAREFAAVPHPVGNSTVQTEFFSPTVQSLLSCKMQYSARTVGSGKSDTNTYPRRNFPRPIKAYIRLPHKAKTRPASTKHHSALLLDHGGHRTRELTPRPWMSSSGGSCLVPHVDPGHPLLVGRLLQTTIVLDRLGNQCTCYRL